MRNLIPAVVASLAVLPAATLAQNYDASDPQRLASLIQDLGYKASLETDNVGDPKIRSAADGTNFSIYFYGCVNNRDCTEIQFSAGFDLSSPSSSEAMNQWNRNKRFGSAYIDDEGDPYVQLDINLDDGGVPGTNLGDSFALWELVLIDFKEHIDW